MEGVVESQPGCEVDGGCGMGFPPTVFVSSRTHFLTGANRVGAIIYFCLFMVIGGLITLNLFITVVLENFNEQQKYDFAQDVLADFKDRWRNYDKKCVGWLQVESFLDLLKKTDPPVGLYRPDSAAEMVRHLRFLSIPVSRDGKLRYVTLPVVPISLHTIHQVHRCHAVHQQKALRHRRRRPPYPEEVRTHL